MTHGSQQLRRFRIAIRDGATVEDAAITAGMGIDEARSWAKDDAKNPPPVEAYRLLGGQPAPSRIRVTQGDCVEVLRARTGPLFDAVVTDPPYHLTSIVERFGKSGAAPAQHGTDGAFVRASRGFMGKEWDGGDVAFRPETWRAVFDQLKPGAHLVAFSGTRTYHRMAVAIEDAGFEIRDQLAWAYGSGFPKSLDVSKAIDKAAGVEFSSRPASGVGFMGADGPGGYNPTINRLDQVGERTPEAAQWSGWGTALKPAWEPICLARKPLGERTVAANVLAHGTGGINIDGCRIEGERVTTGNGSTNAIYGDLSYTAGQKWESHNAGRFPANLLHDGSAEVEALFPTTGGGAFPSSRGGGGISTGGHSGQTEVEARQLDSGSAARFFYSAKAGPLDRLGSEHPTVKPVDLMRWLCRLITPPGGVILDPFAGSGTTGIAALAEGFSAELIDLEADHVADIESKLAHLRGEGARIVERHLKRKAERAKPAGGTLFD